MSNNVTAPFTGSGDATAVVETEQQAAGAHRQRVAVPEFSDLAMRQAMTAIAILAQALDGSGRLRIVAEAVGTPGSTITATGSGLNVQTSASVFGVSLNNISASPGSGNKPDCMPFDLMQAAWAQSVANFISR